MYLSKGYQNILGECSDRAERHDFDHDFCYSFPLFSSLLKKREEEKENLVAKLVIKSHAFLLDQCSLFVSGGTLKSLINQLPSVSY